MGRHLSRLPPKYRKMTVRKISLRALAPAFFTICLFVAGCGEKQFQAMAEATPERAAGIYVFSWPSGEREELEIRVNHTYDHRAWISAPGGRQMTHHSEGRWSAAVGGDHIWNKITFTEFYSMYDDHQLSKPRAPAMPFHSMSMYWEPDDANGPAKIRYSLESEYVFTKTVKPDTPPRTRL